MAPLWGSAHERKRRVCGLVVSVAPDLGHRERVGAVRNKHGQNDASFFLLVAE